jgi:C1A family cysteine protease
MKLSNFFLAASAIFNFSFHVANGIKLNDDELNLIVDDILGVTVDDYSQKLSDNTNSYWYEFNNFINKYNKKYDDDELKLRFSIFSENLYKIRNHDFDFELGINQFADLNQYEFKNIANNNFLSNTDKNGNKNNNLRGFNYGFNQVHRVNKVECKSFSLLFNNTELNTILDHTSSDLPNEIDWRQLGAVTVPKDQGNCGSCWSFSTTGAIEGAWAIKYGTLISLSEQYLIDCSSENNGCQGGLMESAFEFVIEKGGICSEQEIPYEGKQHLVCKPCDKSVKISSCVDVTPNNQLHLKVAVSKGPVSIAIEADTSVFQFYSGGVIDNVKCGTNLDHGVLIVGYGNENGKDYWLVKNSWGFNWGDGGFVKIGRSSDVNDPGICGIAMQPSYPVL